MLGVERRVLLVPVEMNPIYRFGEAGLDWVYQPRKEME